MLKTINQNDIFLWKENGEYITFHDKNGRISEQLVGDLHQRGNDGDENGGRKDPRLWILKRIIPFSIEIYDSVFLEQLKLIYDKNK